MKPEQYHTPTPKPETEPNQAAAGFLARMHNLGGSILEAVTTPRVVTAAATTLALVGIAPEVTPVLAETTPQTQTAPAPEAKPPLKTIVRGVSLKLREVELNDTHDGLTYDFQVKATNKNRRGDKVNLIVKSDDAQFNRKTKLTPRTKKLAGKLALPDLAEQTLTAAEPTLYHERITIEAKKAKTIVYRRQQDLTINPDGKVTLESVPGVEKDKKTSGKFPSPGVIAKQRAKLPSYDSPKAQAEAREIYKRCPVSLIASAGGDQKRSYGKLVQRVVKIDGEQHVQYELTTRMDICDVTVATDWDDKNPPARKVFHPKMKYSSKKKAYIYTDPQVNGEPYTTSVMYVNLR